MRSGLLAFGAMIWAAPLVAQPARTRSLRYRRGARHSKPARRCATAARDSPASRHPSGRRRAQGLARRVRRDRFGQLGVGAGRHRRPCRRSILTPVAKAELYTAKGSPVVDLASLQALIAEAPELPQAEQLATMAIKRGALTPPSIIGERPTYSIGSAPYRYKAKPVQGEPYADQLRSLIDSLVKADDASGAEAQLIQYAPQLSVEARAEASTRVAFIYYVLGQDADARRVADTWRVGIDRRMGQPGRLGLGARLVAARRLERRIERVPAGCATRAAARASRRRLLLGGPRRAGGWAAWRGRAAAPGRRDDRRGDRKLLRARRARDARHADPARGRPIHRLRSADRSISQRPARHRAGEDRRAGAAPRSCFDTRRRSAFRRSTTP